MTTQPVISVRGEAIIEAEPEIADINVNVLARDRDRRTALDNLVARNAQVLALIKGYGDAVEKLESGTASVYPEMKDRSRDERVLRYAARASMRVTIRDFTVLGELVTRLADGDLVTIVGPWWSLRPDSPVYRRARIAAAQDATRRAEEYAGAFNAQLGGLIEAADKGLLTGGDERDSGWHPQAARAGAAPMVAAGAARGSDPASLDFEPAKQRVTANIDARFHVISNDQAPLKLPTEPRPRWLNASAFALRNYMELLGVTAWQSVMKRPSP
jgi:hypothetical protein